MMAPWQMQVSRSDLAATRVTNEATEQPQDGDVLFAVDTFAMTANNATYAVCGDAMAYWDFFPVDNEWGVVPVWGFADVVESRHPSFNEGDRYYGYWPSGSHLTVTPIRTSARGFVDGADHRSELPSVYNAYQRVPGSNADSDTTTTAHDEALQSLLKPLFTTSFFIDDSLADASFHGADQVLVSSASSKTAMALAYCLDQRGIPAIGLTSAVNAEFVRGLGWYDEVLTYDQLADADTPALAVASIYVDMSGNAEVRANIHANARDLRFDLMVGATHWEAAGNDASLPGPAPELFFAPSQVAKRTKEWGADGVASKMAEAWIPFIAEVGERLAVQVTHGSIACQEAFAAALGGQADPAVGIIIAAGN